MRGGVAFLLSQCICLGFAENACKYGKTFPWRTKIILKKRLKWWIPWRIILWGYLMGALLEYCKWETVTWVKAGADPTGIAQDFDFIGWTWMGKGEREVMERLHSHRILLQKITAFKENNLFENRMEASLPMGRSSNPKRSKKTSRTKSTSPRLGWGVGALGCESPAPSSPGARGEAQGRAGSR